MSRSLLNRAWYQLWRRSLKLVAVFVYRVRFSGQENIPATGGVLVVSNHQSHFDPPLVGIGCRRQMNYVARRTLFSFPPFGWFLHSVGAIPIDRDGIGLGGIKESLKLLKRGEMVLIFPEGTRTSDGEIKPFRPGFTALAARSNAAILPVAVDGAFHPANPIANSVMTICVLIIHLDVREHDFAVQLYNCRPSANTGVDFVVSS